MQQQDWKQALGNAFNLPQPDNNTPTPPPAEAPRGDALQQQGKQRVDIVLERKGRAGKQATIITGLVADDDAVKQLASTLKRQLGVGGSARGGEILIQGDFRQRVLEALLRQGFNARII